MAILSPTREAMPKLPGLERIHRGKVRDTYRLSDTLRLFFATDAISIFDFVLNATVRDKGWVLNVMSHHFLTTLEANGLRTHLVAAGADIDEYLPKHLRNNVYVQMRAMVVKDLTMIPIEFVHRAHYVAASSAFKTYDPTRGGDICGHLLPAGLQDGDKLPYIMDTPTTKSESGDETLNFRAVRDAYPEAARMSRKGFEITSKLLENRGILKLDDKCELGVDRDGALYFADEVGTPDCSRFVQRSEWEEAQKLDVRRSPPPADKQMVRAKGIKLGINKLCAKVPENHTLVHSMHFPQRVLNETSHVYFGIAEQALGMSVKDYSRAVLTIRLPA